MSESQVETVDISLDFEIAGRSLAARVRLSKGPTHPRTMLPIFQKLTDTLVDIAEQQTTERGKTISCRKGCAACCRQLVPVTEAEARQLVQLVDAMEPSRQADVLGRFHSAREKLEGRGLLNTLEHPENIGKADRDRLAMEYFSLGIPCPFLEDELCSIRSDRPFICREFLVTSPAERCASGFENIEKVPMPASMAHAVSSLGCQPGDRSKWVPLIAARQWAAAHPEPPAVATGPELFREVLEWL